MPRWVLIWVMSVGERGVRADLVPAQQRLVRPCGRLATGRIRVPGLEVDVIIEDVGAHGVGLHADVDDAYRNKYERYGRDAVDRMVTPDAAAAILQLDPEQASPARTGVTGQRFIASTAGRTATGHVRCAFREKTLDAITVAHGRTPIREGPTIMVPVGLGAPRG